MHGLGSITLRDVAARVGMRAPSLDWHFNSKKDLYDAMFGQASGSYLEFAKAMDGPLPSTPRAALRAGVRRYFDFCAADRPATCC